VLKKKATKSELESEEKVMISFHQECHPIHPLPICESKGSGCADLLQLKFLITRGKPPKSGFQS
jgi:hypothetical protein